MHITDFVTSSLLLLSALLYSSVGHAGASGYLAVMALTGVEPAQMKFAALSLNVLVAVVATLRFYFAGSFAWRLLWPLALTSVPLAFIGGSITLPSHYYRPLVGVVLIYAAWRSFATAKSANDAEIRHVGWPVLLPIGAVLGLLSGLTGVGGGIFLSPLLIFMRWADTKTVSGVSAAFILVNSMAGLLGVMGTGSYVVSPSLPVWLGVVLVGGYIGATFGSRRLGNPTIQRLLALVLLVAGVKMCLT